MVTVANVKKMRCFGCATIGIIAVINIIWTNNSSQKVADDLLLSNIEALRASATEAVCDTKTDKECKITHASGLIGISTGHMNVWN